MPDLDEDVDVIIVVTSDEEPGPEPEDSDVDIVALSSSEEDEGPKVQNRPCPASKKRKNDDISRPGPASKTRRTDVKASRPGPASKTRRSDAQESRPCPASKKLKNGDTSRPGPASKTRREDIPVSRPGPASKKLKECDISRPCPASKKSNNGDISRSDIPVSRPCPASKKLKTSGGRCKFCHQSLDHVAMKPEDEPESLSELEMIEKYQVEPNEDDLPLFFLTNYFLYDSANHLVALDSQLIENGKTVKFSGNAKLVDIDPENPEGGLAVAQIGPITEWWVTGYNDDEKEYAIGISTDKADYLIKNKPGSGYEFQMKSLEEKVKLTKITMKSVGTYENAVRLDYDDLLMEITTDAFEYGIEDFSREKLTEHTPFIIEQVITLILTNYIFLISKIQHKVTTYIKCTHPPFLLSR